MKNRQIDALTATRGFAALLIVIFHFGLERTPFVHLQQFFTKGNLAVSYFFVLSGFIMCFTYQDKHVPYANYMKRRVGRIVPLYLFALFAYAAYMLWYSIEPAPDYSIKKGLLLNTFFLQAYVPKYALSINSPGWSLSVEMCFYLLFPAFLVLYKRSIKLFTAVALVVYIISQALHIYLVNRPAITEDMHAFTYYNPLLHLNAFLIGMLGCHYFNTLKEHTKWQFPLLLFIVIIAAVMYMPPYLHNGLLAPLVVLFIIAIAIKQPALLNLKPLVWLGEISYGIYILQFPVYAYWQLLNIKRLHIENANTFFYSYLLLLLMTSALCYKCIEQPLRKWISNMGVK